MKSNLKASMANLKLLLATVSVSVIFANNLTVLAEENTDISDEEIQRLTEMSLEEIMNTQIYSASKRPEKLSQTASAAFVLTAKDIEKAGVTSIPEALRLVPGVQVAQINANNWAISIRGFNRQFSNKLLVMVDGRTVYTPLFSGVFWSDLDYILDDIDRIEVIRGPGGTLWGANAVNGVINIITKEARKTQGNLASFTTGTHENAITEFRHGGSTEDDNHYRVYGKFRKHSDFKAVGAETSADDNWQRGQAGFRYDFRDYDYDKVTVQGDYYYGRRFSNLSIPTTTTPVGAVYDEDSTGGNVLFRWNKPIGEVATELSGYIDYQYRDSMPLNQQELVTYNLDYQGNYDTERHSITGGVGYRLVTSNLNGSNLISYTPETMSLTTYNIFLQDKIEVIEDKLFLTLGSKFSYNDFTNFEYQPNARILYQITDGHSIWASASRAVRLPSIAEESSTLAASPPFPLGSAFQTGNSSFNSEVLHAYEMGYRGDLTNNLYLDITAFYNDYKDLRTFEVISGAPLTLSAFNNGTGETYGVETYAVAGVTDNLEIRAGYTFLTQHFHENTSDNSLQRDEGRSPNIQYNLSTQYRFNEILTWNNYLYYVSDLRYFDITGQQFNIDDYTRFDTVFNIKATENIDLNIFGRNLFDNFHQEFDEIIYGTPSEIQRTFGIQTKIRF